MQFINKIVLFIDSEPFVGGSFQYNLSILEAASALPSNKYKTVVMYTSKLWEQYINKNVEKINVRFSKRNKEIIQFILMAGIPLSIISMFLNWSHPVAIAIADQKPDMCIFPSQESFWGYITKKDSIVAIHDLMHRYEKKFKEVSGYGKYFHKEKHFRNICKHSKGILVDSELGKIHVHESYSLPLDYIHVLPYISRLQIYDNYAAKNCNYKFILPHKYIFYPAQFWQHKNHIRLIKAVHSLRKDCPDIQLVLVGSKNKEYENVAKLVRDLNLERAVHFIGFVPERNLVEFYKKATALVMPTFFGPTNIPPLEAFSLGCPVAVSNVYGMSEQVGDSGLLFDPNSVASIAEAIKRLWLSDDLRQRLIQKGFEKAKKWGQTEFNNKFIEIIEDIVL